MNWLRVQRGLHYATVEADCGSRYNLGVYRAGPARKSWYWKALTVWGGTTHTVANSTEPATLADAKRLAAEWWDANKGGLL